MRNGDVGVFFQQVDDAVAGVQFQLDLRILRAEVGHQRRDHMQHERHGGVDAQAPGRLLAAQGDQLLGFVDGGEDAARVRQEGRALVGQRQPARGAGQQRGLQLLFQPAQCAAHTRDGLAELFGGGGDRAGVDHRAEGEQFFERRFHGGVGQIINF